MKIKILSAVFVLSLAFVAYFGISLALEIHTDRQGRTFYADIAPVGFKPRQTAVNQTAEHQSDDVWLFDQAVFEPFVPFVDFDEKREDFPSIVAWIQSEGTVINYPVVQGVDNDFYLHRLPDGSSHPWGSIFLDYRNAADFSDYNILIYGHNMRSGDMFGSLKYYARQEFFEQHPSMFIFTPTHNFSLQLFAGYVIDSAFETVPLRFAGEGHFYDFIADIRGRSVFQSEVEVGFGDTLVFLCTCTDSGNINERLIIVGKLIEI